MTAKDLEAAPGIDVESGRAFFDYIKSNQYRVIHVDGAFGGPSPRQNYIYMAVWNERWPIPKQSVHELASQGESGSGKLGKEIKEDRVTRDAIIREVEVGLIMDVDTARRMRDWLTEKIKVFEDRQSDGDSHIDSAV